MSSSSHCYYFNEVLSFSWVCSVHVYNTAFILPEPLNLHALWNLVLGDSANAQPPALMFQSGRRSSSGHLLNFFLCFNWRKFALRCYNGFYHTTMQISHNDTPITSLLIISPLLPSHSSRSSQIAWLGSLCEFLFPAFQKNLGGSEELWIKSLGKWEKD